jgi:hypothetical protein
MPYIIAAAALVWGVAVLIYVLKNQGRAAERNDQMKQRLEDIHAATMARDRLDRDADDAKRVRGRFTRKLL